MARSLVIVESPAKASTLEKFLGKDFRVAACYGHVRDLDRKGIAVDRSRNYEPNYRIVPGKERTVAELSRLAKKAERIFLAADPDREGEAICWHLRELLKKEAPQAEFHRAEFQEITKSAVTRAIEKPGKISKDRVGAQQARRIIDRLVGYEVSELLWNKVWRGLSAGRVQTVALRIIVERETERERFRAVPYFSVPVTLEKDGAAFPARVVAWRGEKLQFDGTDPRLATAEAAEAVRAHVEGSALRVTSVEARERRQNAAPPFTTPKLQQAAARSLGFSVRKTMTLAQRLYEGRAVGDRGTVGLITYMRTDSTRVADEALEAVRAHILSTYGEASLPSEARRFRQKKDAQDAHEAIRPTSMDLPPEAVASYLEPDEQKLYRLVWNRFVASQMNPAVSEVTTVEIEARRAASPGAGPANDVAGLRATGSVLKDPGFLRLYGQVAETEGENAPEDEGDGDETKVRLPPLAQGDALALREARVDAHETQPPPRFNEASLVKFMEENGIGRPSTYADILRKIEQREYVHKKERRFIPTPLGRLVVDLMKEGFEDFFQTEYTARMEEELDEVEEGKVDWRQALRDFDGKFSKDRERAKKKMHSVKAGLALPLVREAFNDFRLTSDPGDTCPVSGHPLKLRMGKAGLFVACGGYPDCTWTVDIPETEEDPVDPSELEGQICDECGSPMRLRTGRNGSVFLGCTAYPKCRNAISVAIQGGKAEARPAEPTGEKCPVCGHDLVKRHGRFGDYVSCSNYPDCRYKPPKPVTLTGVTCPECNQGRILERRGRFGPFYGCSRYPECRRNFRARPVPKPCPQCGTAYLLVRERKAGPFYVCETEGCGYDEPARDLERYPVTTEITEEARQAALAAAVAPPPKKRPRKKAPAAPEAETPSADDRAAGRKAAGRRPVPAAAAGGSRRPTGRKVAASARPKRAPRKT
ncbi:MAG TPA: type I DNA topoisomerase [Vicinamibacteria bacterium]|nr:type I DNA topoisomerase [Vicinamibacteria bacterium]